MLASDITIVIPSSKPYLSRTHPAHSDTLVKKNPIHTNDEAGGEAYI